MKRSTWASSSCLLPVVHRTECLLIFVLCRWCKSKPEHLSILQAPPRDSLSASPRAPPVDFLGSPCHGTLTEAKLTNKHKAEVYVHPSEVIGHILLPHIRASATVRPTSVSLTYICNTASLPTILSPLPRPHLRPNPFQARLNPKYRPIYALDISWYFLADHGRGQPARLHASSPLQLHTLQ